LYSDERHLTKDAFVVEPEKRAPDGRYTQQKGVPATQILDAKIGMTGRLAP
jgi:hypothetical protein